MKHSITPAWWHNHHKMTEIAKALEKELTDILNDPSLDEDLRKKLLTAVEFGYTTGVLSQDYVDDDDRSSFEHVSDTYKDIVTKLETSKWQYEIEEEQLEIEKNRMEARE